MLSVQHGCLFFNTLSVFFSEILPQRPKITGVHILAGNMDKCFILPGGGKKGEKKSTRQQWRMKESGNNKTTPSPFDYV